MFKPAKGNICHCERCGYDWLSYGLPLPIACAGCKSRSWNVPKKIKVTTPKQKRKLK